MRSKPSLTSWFVNLIGTSMLIMVVSGCVGSPLDVAGNEKGSKPVNNEEVTSYKKAIVRCYKIGGTRVVKIEGQLRCY